METKAFEFEFLLDDATAALAEAIMDAVTAIAEAGGATVGGGYTVYREDGDGEAQSG